MTANKTTEILQQQIDKLNQEQTETKWNEKDKKLFEKFLGLVHDDPFRIFYADGGEVHRILELVYPESVKGRIEELFRIKYIYDGFLKYGDIVKPQIEIERPNLEILIKDISDHYLDVYRNRKKVKENEIRNCRTILEKANKKHYITMDDCDVLLKLTDRTNRTLDEKIAVLNEVLETNNSAIQELLKMKISKRPSVKTEVEEKEITVEEEPPLVSMIEPDSEEMDIEISEDDFFEPGETEIDPVVEKDIPDYEEEIVENQKEQDEVNHQEVEESTFEDMDTIIEEMPKNDISNVESYIELYLSALEEIDPTDITTIQSVLPKAHMPNFNEIMDSLIKALKKQISEIKEEEQNSEVKKVRILREELGKAQQLLKTVTNYLDKQEKKDTENSEKIIEGEEIQLLLLETEDGECLIERDFKKQLDRSQYRVAMDLLACIEQFSDPSFRIKGKESVVPGILEVASEGVHIFFEPFAENTYIVIALLADKHGYSLWLEDKLRLRHSLFKKQEKGMQRRWNQHGTRNTMLLGSETAYLEMQDLAEMR